MNYYKDNPIDSFPPPRPALVARIVKDGGKDVVEAEVMAREMETLDASLHPRFIKWWNTGEIDLTIEIEGYSFRRLFDERKCSTILAAFTWHSALTLRPERAKMLLTTPIRRLTLDPESVAKLRKEKGH